MDIFYNITDMATRHIDNNEDVVVYVKFKITGIGDLGSSVSIIKEINFNNYGDSFILFEDLTKEQVISWMFNEAYTEEILNEELRKSQVKHKMPVSWVEVT